MTDKEVGELWRKINEGIYEHAIEKSLIRKLVEERQLVHSLNNIISEGEPLERQRTIKGTLAQFGIDPATWKD